MPGPLNCRGQPSLMMGAITGNTARNYFAPFIYKSSQQPVIMIADGLYPFFTEAANPPSFSKIRHGNSFLFWYIN